MSEFSKLTLTKKGAELLASAVGADSITFTKFALGDGDYALDFSNATQLVSKKQEVAISEQLRDTNTLKIKGVLEIGNVTESFYWKELGIYARGNDGVEILYMYANAGSKYSYIGTTGFDEKIIEVLLQISSTTNVNVVIDPTNIDKHNQDPRAHKEMYDRVSNRLPGVNDDSTRGYVVGSLWYFGGTLYCCENSTAGAALWKEYAGYGILTTINNAIDTAKQESKAYTDTKVADASLLTTGKVPSNVLNISTGTQAEAGLDDTTVMTPKKVLQSIRANASGGSGDINMFAMSTNNHKFTATSDTTTFTLSSSVYTPEVDVVVLSYEGVEMEYGDAYTMSGATVTLDFTLKIGESIDFMVYRMSYDYRDLKGTPDIGDPCTLLTASKVVVPAINENTQQINNLSQFAFKKYTEQPSDLTVELKQGSYLTPSSGVVGLPINWSQGRHTFIANGVGANNVYDLQFITSYTTQKLAYKSGLSRDWKEIATTDKIDISFPYAPGFSDIGGVETNVRSIVSKTNTGVVSVGLNAKHEGITERTLIGTLPVGYRPSVDIAILSSENTGIDKVVVISVFQGGAVYVCPVKSINPTLNSFRGCLTYVATN